MTFEQKFQEFLDPGYFNIEIVFPFDEWQSCVSSNEIRSLRLLFSRCISSLNDSDKPVWIKSAVAYQMLKTMLLNDNKPVYYLDLCIHYLDNYKLIDLVKESVIKKEILFSYVLSLENNMLFTFFVIWCFLPDTTHFLYDYNYIFTRELKRLLKRKIENIYKLLNSSLVDIFLKKKIFSILEASKIRFPQLHIFLLNHIHHTLFHAPCALIPKNKVFAEKIISLTLLSNTLKLPYSTLKEFFNATDSKFTLSELE